MFSPSAQTKVYLALGATDMRKAINGLSMLTQGELDLDPFSGHLYVFCNRRRTIIKILYWDRNGFCLWQKRLERDKFPWPQSEEAAREISSEQLKMLLDGIDFWHAHQRIDYQAVS